VLTVGDGSSSRERIHCLPDGDRFGRTKGADGKAAEAEVQGGDPTHRA
jgi:hypothetical protein